MPQSPKEHPTTKLVTLGREINPKRPKAESSSGLPISTNHPLVPGQSLDLYAQMWGRTSAFNMHRQIEV